MAMTIAQLNLIVEAHKAETDARITALEQRVAVAEAAISGWSAQIAAWQAALKVMEATVKANGWFPIPPDQGTLQSQV